MTGLGPIFFAHLPKSAGTSLHALFDALFSSAEMLVSDGTVTRDRVYATPFRFLAARRYVGGHFPDALCAEKIGPAVRLTTIRDPLDRLQSWMNHAIRADWPARPAFEAFLQGRPEALQAWLGRAWYAPQPGPMQPSALTCLAPADLVAGLHRDPAAHVDTVARHVIGSYAAILPSDGVDALVEALLPELAHGRGMRQMVGRSLGPYHDLRDRFGPGVRQFLAPEIALHDRLRAHAAAHPVDPAALVAPRPRSVWWLDWDAPQPARGFLLRRQATFPLSLQPGFTSRLIEGRVASIFVAPGFVPRRFSGLVHVSEPGDIARLRLFHGRAEVAFSARILAPRVLFFSGEVPVGTGAGTGVGTGAEWAFDLSEGRQSANAWLHDFVLYG